MEDGRSCNTTFELELTGKRFFLRVQATLGVRFMYYYPQLISYRNSIDYELVLTASFSIERNFIITCPEELITNPNPDKESHQLLVTKNISMFAS